MEGPLRFEQIPLYPQSLALTCHMSTNMGFGSWDVLDRTFKNLLSYFSGLEVAIWNLLIGVFCWRVRGNGICIFMCVFCFVVAQTGPEGALI